MLLISAIAVSTPVSADKGKLTVVLINDVYRLDYLPSVRTLRARLERQHGPVLLLHAGDFLFPSLLSRKFKGQQMIDVMNQLDGDHKAIDPHMLVTFGNHEFDKRRRSQAVMLQQRITESQFDWVSSNTHFSENEKGQPLVAADNLLPWKILTINGIRVGIFALTIDSKHPGYIDRFDEPVETARLMSAKLRAQGVDLVIGLTHLEMKQDRQILNSLKENGPDIIFGGHEHSRQVAQVAGRLVIKADADAMSAAVVHIEPEDGQPPGVDYHFQAMADEIPPDSSIQQSVMRWHRLYDTAHCKRIGLESNCLQEIVGRTDVELVAEELQIRRFETNIGNWIADQALERFADGGAQIAFVNSGSLRLDHNIPAGSRIDRKTINKLFAYPNHMVVIRISGARLQQIIDRAIDDWNGHGHWLQIAGFRFRHDPEKQVADQLTLVTAEGTRPVRADEQINAVTVFYLVDQKGDQDGYRMLDRDMIIDKKLSRPKLRNIVIDALKNTLPHGISPVTDGRIENTRDRLR